MLIHELIQHILCINNLELNIVKQPIIIQKKK